MFEFSNNRHLLGIFAIPLLFLASPVASQEKSAPGAQCPSGFSLSHPDGKYSSHYEVEGLAKKMYTVADFEEHLQYLQKTLEYAKARAASNSGVSITHRNSFRPDDISGDLHGCKLRRDYGNACGDYVYIIPRRDRPMADSISPRIETYLCHQRAGWPTAIDSKSTAAPKKAPAENPGASGNKSPPPEPSGGYESGDGKTLPDSRFVPLDPERNHEGKPCSYFTKPAVTNDGGRLNYYGDGAFVVYGKWMYKCSFGRWESAGLTRLWAKDDVERLRAEKQEKIRWQHDKRFFEEE